MVEGEAQKLSVAKCIKRRTGQGLDDLAKKELAWLGYSLGPSFDAAASQQLRQLRERHTCTMGTCQAGSGEQGAVSRRQDSGQQTKPIEEMLLTPNETRQQQQQQHREKTKLVSTRAVLLGPRPARAAQDATRHGAIGRLQHLRVKVERERRRAKTAVLLLCAAVAAIK